MARVLDVIASFNWFMEKAMSTRNAELLMAIGMLVFSLGMMWNIHSDGLVIGWVPERGPGSGVWPFWLSLGMALCSVWTLVRWFRGITPEIGITHLILTLRASAWWCCPLFFLLP